MNKTKKTKDKTPDYQKRACTAYKERKNIVSFAISITKKQKDEITQRVKLSHYKNNVDFILSAMDALLPHLPDDAQPNTETETPTQIGEQ